MKIIYDYNYGFKFYDGAFCLIGSLPMKEPVLDFVPIRKIQMASCLTGKIVCDLKEVDKIIQSFVEERNPDTTVRLLREFKIFDNECKKPIMKVTDESVAAALAGNYQQFLEKETTFEELAETYIRTEEGKKLFTARTWNILCKMPNVNTLVDLAILSDKELKRASRVGEGTVEEIRTVLKFYGI